MTYEADLKAFNKCYVGTILLERRANERDDAMNDVDHWSMPGEAPPPIPEPTPERLRANKAKIMEILEQAGGNKPMSDDKIMTADELFEDHKIRLTPISLGEVVLERLSESGFWKCFGDPNGYPTMIAARRAATEIVRGEAKPKRYAELSKMLDEWASDPTDFDERVVPTILEALAHTSSRHQAEKPKVEKINMESVPTMGELAHLLDKANLYRIIDPDGTLRVPQRWPDWVLKMTGTYSLEDDDAARDLADQRAIREGE
jgi:hypothetical protein